MHPGLQMRNARTVAGTGLEYHAGWARMAATTVGSAWSRSTSRALGIPFIGIGSGVHASRLTSEGAIHVFQEFSKYDLFLESIDAIT